MSKLNVEYHLDCKLIKFSPLSDSRGFFYESFNEEISKITGFWPKQENISKSSKGVIRGLHMQHSPPAAKLIRVVSGKIRDVAVDFRKSSSSYGKHVYVDLDDSFPHWFLIPEGHLHGFSVLSEYAVVNYLVSTPYSPGGEISVNPFSRSLGIDWKITREESLLSEKDKNAIDFEEINQ